MILFDIKCNDGHVFEAWFQNNEAFENLAQSDLVECPLCGCTKVSKSLMSPNISAKNKEKLKKGMTITVEPGIYIPKKFGVRIEDSLIVKDSASVMHKFTKDLIVI